MRTNVQQQVVHWDKSILVHMHVNFVLVVVQQRRRRRRPPPLLQHRSNIKKIPFSFKKSEILLNILNLDRAIWDAGVMIQLREF